MITQLAARFSIDDWWVGPVSIVAFGVVVMLAAHALSWAEKRKKRDP